MFKAAFYFFTIISISAVTFAQTNKCDEKSYKDHTKALQKIAGFIQDSKNQNKIISPIKLNLEDLKAGQVIVSRKGENIDLSSKDKKFNFYIQENTKIELIKAATQMCGPQVKLIYGQLTAEGEHQKNESCDFELETPLFYIKPTGTRYNSSVDLSNAIAELNGESDAGVANESHHVEKGSVEIKLVKISKKSKLKTTKLSKNKTQKSVKVAEIGKLKEKTLKLKTGSKIAAKVKKSKSKEKVADIEVIDPFQ